ncbi:HNH endonuclease signature motif containing protein [Rhodococcus erythropolis]|nr:HNH endonuclease signature motif containing protein [Rhodococcus erythropolis]
MYSIKPPTRTDIEDYDAIIKNRRPLTKRKLLIEARNDVVDKYSKYATSYSDSATTSLAEPKSALHDALYGNFAALDVGSRYESMRADLLKEVRDSLCPYCSLNSADSIDHVLPRSVLPEYSVLGTNLVPCCEKCNHLKKDQCPHTGRTFIHPYFDQLPDEQFVFAKVEIGSEVVFNFRLEKPNEMTDELFKALTDHFEALNLYERFGIAAIWEAGDRAGNISDIFATSQTGYQTEAIQKYLNAEFQSARSKRGINYWKSVTLQGMADSTEFCSGGFATLVGP